MASLLSIDTASSKFRVKILVKLDSNLVVKTDTYASLQIQGITGFKFIQLSGGSEKAPILKAIDSKYPIISSKESFFASIDKQTTNILELISSLKFKLEILLSDKNLKHFENFLFNSSQLVEKLNKQSLPFLSNIHNTSSKVAKSSEDFSVFLNKVNLEFDELEKSKVLLNDNLEILRFLLLDFTQLLEKLKQNPSSVIYKDQKTQYAPGE